MAIETADTLSIIAEVSWPEPVPEFVWERLVRGLPATIETQTELWKRRGMWPDANLGVWIEQQEFLRDPWSGAFRRISTGEIAVADSLPLLTRLLERTRHTVPLDSSWCDSRSAYQVVVTRVIRPLTTKDLREVEGWLQWGGGPDAGSDFGVPRVVFGVMRGITGLGDRRRRVSSEWFRLARDAAGAPQILPVE